MNKLDNLMDMAKLNEFLGKREEEKDECRAIVWVLAVIGAIAAVAAIAYAVYRYMNPRYLDDFEDEFEDEFEDDFFVDEGEN